MRKGMLLGAPWWLWAAALAPRLGLWLLAAGDPARFVPIDGVGYLALAGNMLDHGVFSTGPEPFVPNTFRTPGYPLFLAPFVALFDAPVLPAALAQCLIGAATAVLLWRWLEPRWGRLAAAVGALAVALDLVTIFHTPMLLSETVFVFLVVAAFVRTWDQIERPGLKGAALCGLLWGVGALVRPLSFHLPVALVWVWRRDRKAAACFLLAAYLLPGAWMARNFRATGVSAFSGVGGVAMLSYMAAGIESLRLGGTVKERDLELQAVADAEHPGGYASDAERSQVYGRVGARVIGAHPFLLVRYCSWGLLKTLAGTGLEMLPQWAGRPEGIDAEYRVKASGRGTVALLRRYPWLIPLQLGYMAALAALYLLCAAGLLRFWRERRRAEAAFLGLILGYFLAFSSSQGYYRYRIPCVPLLAVGAAAAVAARRFDTIEKDGIQENRGS
ncbi:MAG: glycosyltransferase family 39 protein [Elusimicrobia bacterium]|nr:glycosyltransferase family 39 protein [Elusimicrobiota bacterium]